MNDVVWQLLRGGLATRALALAAEARVHERLADGPRRIEDETLRRVLRALASEGVFEEVEPGVFANTEASAALLADGWDDFARLFGGVWLRAVADLDLSGEPSFPRLFGADWWAWLAEHPAERAAFDRAMAQGWQTRIERLESVDWRDGETVVDVGGGNGSLLRELLARRPGLRGVVFDLPETVRDESTFGDRLAFVAGSFFERVPPGDTFLLSTILHDWDDEPAAAILRTVRSAAAPDARLVLLEQIVPPGNEPGGGKWLDLLLLALSAGRERTEPEWRALLAATGWEPTRLAGGLIEARCR